MELGINGIYRKDRIYYLCPYEKKEWFLLGRYFKTFFEIKQLLRRYHFIAVCILITK